MPFFIGRKSKRSLVCGLMEVFLVVVGVGRDFFPRKGHVQEFFSSFYALARAQPGSKSWRHVRSSCVSRCGSIHRESPSNGKNLGVSGIKASQGWEEEIKNEGTIRFCVLRLSNKIEMVKKI